MIIARPLTARPLTARPLTALRLGETPDQLALALRDEDNSPLLAENGALLLEEIE